VVKPNSSNELVFTIYQSNWRFLVKEVSRGSDTTCKESDARSLRGGAVELGNLKTLTYGFTIFTQSKLEHTILMIPHDSHFISLASP
jgi:hypothetical protein